MNKTRILAVAVIFLILCSAGIIKIFYPSPVLKNFYIVVGIFELLLAIALVLFSRRGEIWAVLVLVFAAWGGYAFYTTLFGLPCSCLGSALVLPRGVFFCLNLAIFGTSWGLLKGTSFSLLNFRWLSVLSIVLFVVGFVLSMLIYNFLVEV